MINWREKRQSPRLRVVAFGGGTGLSRLLTGFKPRVRFPHEPSPDSRQWSISNLTAVVTVTDDGGSSGRLRREFGILPPGDIRNCLVALSDSSALLAQLFQHRFKGTGQLGGHSFGNLFLTALRDTTGDFAHAVKVCSQILAIRGNIYPMTLDDVQLAAECDDGRWIVGETLITRSPGAKHRISLVPADCRPLPEVLEAIRSADLITVGPGSLLTSMIPSLLIPKVAQALRRSRAVKLFIGNIMTQPGESDGMSAADHVRMIYRHLGGQLFDAAILNSRPMSSRIIRKYAAQGAVPIRTDRRHLEGLGLKVYTGALAVEEQVVRHDAEHLVRMIGRAHRELAKES